MTSREAPAEDVALLSPAQRRAYEVVIAELKKPGCGLGIMEALRNAKISYTDWGNASQRLRQMKERRRQGATARTPIELQVAEERDARAKRIDQLAAEGEALEAEEEIERERQADRVLRQAERDAVAVPPKTQLPSPASEDAALANVLYAIRRLPVGHRRAVLEAAIAMAAFPA